jgi:hypothetical protein
MMEPSTHAQVETLIQLSVELELIILPFGGGNLY